MAPSGDFEILSGVPEDRARSASSRSADRRDRAGNPRDRRRRSCHPQDRHRDRPARRGHQRPALPGDPAHHKPLGPGVVQPSASPAGRSRTPCRPRLTGLLPLKPAGEGRRLEAQRRGEDHRLLVLRGALAEVRHPPEQRDGERSPWSRSGDTGPAPGGPPGPAPLGSDQGGPARPGAAPSGVGVPPADCNDIVGGRALFFKGSVEPCIIRSMISRRSSH
jgi:hypothetical protein